LSKKRQYFRQFFGENFLKITTSVPDLIAGGDLSDEVAADPDTSSADTVDDVTTRDLETPEILLGCEN
jgi:hypothetical protein